MNREQLIRICLDSGVVRRDVAIKLIETIEANEREACAKVCDEMKKKNDDLGGIMWQVENCSIAIRARNNND